MPRYTSGTASTLGSGLATHGFVYPLLMLGALAAGHTPSAVMPDTGARALRAASYTTTGTAASRVSMDERVPLETGSHAVGVTGADFARLALDVIQRQTRIGADLDLVVSARWHELYE